MCLVGVRHTQYSARELEALLFEHSHDRPDVG
jgi:hypothetical protein